MCKGIEIEGIAQDGFKLISPMWPSLEYLEDACNFLNYQSFKG
jgi:hypothetical protein